MKKHYENGYSSDSSESSSEGFSSVDEVVVTLRERPELLPELLPKLFRFPLEAEDELKSTIEILGSDSDPIDLKILCQILQENIHFLLKESQEYLSQSYHEASSLERTPAGRSRVYIANEKGYIKIYETKGDRYSGQLDLTTAKPKSMNILAGLRSVKSGLEDFKPNHKNQKLIESVIAKPEDFHTQDRAADIAEFICGVMDIRIKIFEIFEAVFHNPRTDRKLFVERTRTDRKLFSGRNGLLQWHLHQYNRLINRFNKRPQDIKAPETPKGTANKATISAGESKAHDPNISLAAAVTGGMELQKLEPVWEMQRVLVGLLNDYVKFINKRKLEQRDPAYEAEFAKEAKKVADTSPIEELMSLVEQKPKFCCTESLSKEITYLILTCKATRVQLEKSSNNFTLFKPDVGVEISMQILNAKHQYFKLLRELKTQLINPKEEPTAPRPGCTIM